MRGRIFAAAIMILALALIQSGRADVISSHVVINEFESNPPSDGSQYFELYNPTPREIDIGGWIVRTVQGGKSYDISAGTLLPPGSFWQTALPGQFINKDGDTLFLMTSQHVIIDQTPMLSDTTSPGDGMTWQRTPDAGTDWRSLEGTRGQTNSQTTTTTATEATTTTTSIEETTTTTITSEEQTATATSEEQTATTTTQQHITTTTTEQITTSTTYQQTMTTTTQQQATTSTTQTGSAQSFGIGFAFAVMGIGAGVAGAVGGLAALSSVQRYPEVFAYAGYYYCRRHRVPMWLVHGGLWCPIERRFLRP